MSLKSSPGASRSSKAQMKKRIVIQSVTAFGIALGLVDYPMTAKARNWETACVISHKLQTMIPPRQSSPDLLDVLVVSLTNQSYVLGRVSGWSRNHTQMAALADRFVQVDRPWGGFPLKSADARIFSFEVRANAQSPWVPFSFAETISMKVLDIRGKQVAYEVMAIAEPDTNCDSGGGN